MTIAAGAVDRWRTTVEGEVPAGRDELLEGKAPHIRLGYDQEVEAVLGGEEWKSGPPQTITRDGLMHTDPRTGLGSMWTTGGGKEDYEELRQKAKSQLSQFCGCLHNAMS